MEQQLVGGVASALAPQALWHGGSVELATPVISQGRGLLVMASAGIKRASVLCGSDVPAEPALIQELDPKALPRWLECHPAWSGECLLGRQLVRSGQQLGLVLPSVVVPQARNLLLNPFTPRSKTKIDQVTPDFSASPKRGVRSPRSRP